MPALVVGDIHCDKLNHKIPKFTSLVLKTLRDTIQMGLERGVSKIIIAGDIFDGPVPTQSTIVSLLDELHRAGVLVYLMLGNHDSADISQHSLQIAKWVGKFSTIKVVLKPTTIKVDNDKVLLLPHPYVEDLPRGYRLGVGHFAVNGAKSDNGFVVRSKHCPKGEWLLGDFHTPQGGRANSCRYKYLGSLSQLGFTEGEKKRVILLEEGEQTSLPVPLAYKLRKKTISSDDDLPEVSDRNIYWQLKYTKDYNLPAGWLANNPNVVEASPVTKRKNKNAEVLLNSTEHTLDPYEYLEPYLRRKKYDNKVVLRSLQLAKELRK